MRTEEGLLRDLLKQFPRGAAVVLARSARFDDGTGVGTKLHRQGKRGTIVRAELRVEGLTRMGIELEVDFGGSKHNALIPSDWVASLLDDEPRACS
jgi:hypothetical protein